MPSIGPKAGANWAVMGFVVIAITQWYVSLSVSKVDNLR